MAVPTDRIKKDRGLRSFILDASEAELKETLSDCGESFDEMSARGRRLVERALGGASDVSEVKDLHRGLGALIHLLRRQKRLTIHELAARVRIDPNELLAIETQSSFEPSPRTIFQLEQFFALPERSLVVLSGSVQVDSSLREEAVRFAASSESIAELSRDEKGLLNRFVKFLREYTDG